VLVAVYCRVSTDDQNIRQQQELLIQHCKKNGWKYRTYTDEAESGKVSDRPAWRRLCMDCEKGQYSAILVSKLDRITRDLRYALEFLEWYDDVKVPVISLYDGKNDLEKPDGRFMFKLKCLLSEYELDNTRWRSRIGIERAKQEGKYKGGVKGRTWKKK
tara:strand:+ start:11480 stop:11956 length:477 start_codon:yes stop_codon:yes gene_type:complete